MNLKLARQLIKTARFDVVEDLLAPAVAIRPRILYASPPSRRGKWLDWLMRPSQQGPSVETVPVLDELTLPIGASRFDSVPDVPLGFEWPCHSGGGLMECLAQINLQEIQSRENLPLPREGWLLFFLGSENVLEKPEARVVYVAPGPLVRWATAVPREYTRQTCRLDFESVFSLPDSHDWCVEQRVSFVNSQIDSYVKLQEQLTNGARHYLLGYPRAIAGDVRAEAVQAQALASRATLSWRQAAEIANEHCLLLQLDSDTAGPGWMWGDVGSLYFVARKSDIAAGRFDRTRLVVQSS